MPIRCEVVSVERLVYEDDVDMVTAPGAEGEMGILPHHAALMTALLPGEIVIHKAGQDDVLLAVGGGFMEVRPDRFTILADSAEKADEIDVERAEAARKRAAERLAEQPVGLDLIRAEYALRRSQVRLRVASRRRGGGAPGAGRPPGGGGAGPGD